MDHNDYSFSRFASPGPFCFSMICLPHGSCKKLPASLYTSAQHLTPHPTRSVPFRRRTLKDVTPAGCPAVNTAAATCKIWLRAPGALSAPTADLCTDKWSLPAQWCCSNKSVHIGFSGRGPCLTRKKRLGDATVIQRMKLIQKRQKSF